MSDIVELLRMDADDEIPYYIDQDGIMEAADEIERNRAAIAELVGALTYALGPKDDEKIGWRGTGHSDSDRLFRCEFCSKIHEDCTLIEHLDDCPVTVARAVLTKHQQPTTTEKE